MSDQFYEIDIEFYLYEYQRRIGLDVEPPERMRKIESNKSTYREANETGTENS